MKKVIGIGSTIIILIIMIIFIKNNYKTSKSGNNISNKSADEIKNYILNIESYQANANIEITSNKTKNVYVVEQEYNKEINSYSQKILEPEVVSGIEFKYDGEKLEIKNNKLALHKIYENYSNIESNELSLAKFIQDYNTSEKQKMYEENDKIVMEVELKQDNKYTRKQEINN